MVSFYITKIDIKKVRHLQDIEINISDTERKHLILTGKNGSGKTSVLNSVWDIFFNNSKIDGNGKHKIFNDSLSLTFNISVSFSHSKVIEITKWYFQKHYNCWKMLPASPKLML